VTKTPLHAPPPADDADDGSDATSGDKAQLGSLNIDELTSWFAARGHKAFRARQVFRWQNLKGAASFDEMSDLPAGLRQELASSATCRELTSLGCEGEPGDTRKLLFRTQRGDPVEAVLIPMRHGSHTLCISSQSGCKLGCTFCLTGALDLSGRNLTAGEIVDQWREATRLLQAATPEDAGRERVDSIDNIVFMGMGEPLFNYRHVVRAIELLRDPLGRAYAPRRLTVSTAGVAPLIERLVAETGVQLAISLNAVDDELRTRLMPVNARWPLATLRQAMAKVPLAPRRRLTIEYVLLAGVNDSVDHARALRQWLRGLQVKVNLIPFNEHEAALYKAPSEATVDDFVSVLADGRVSVQVRRSRGRDLKAACGQLGGELDYRQFLDEDNEE
jgi:23S rRNA (adenine2503-C2)-methyltransferase